MTRPKTVRRLKAVADVSKAPAAHCQTAQILPLTVRARILDRQADAELSHGRHAAAERLSRQAAELRGWPA